MATEINLQDVGEVHLCVEVYVQYQGKVLMHRRSDTKKHFPGFLIGPGGHVNDGEDVAQAASREVKEETGIIVPASSMKLKFVAIHHHVDKGSVWVNWGFQSLPPSTSGELKHSDEGTSEWIDLSELMNIKDSIFPPSREYLDQVLNDAPGILYTNSEWEDSQLVRELSRHLVTV